MTQPNHSLKLNRLVVFKGGSIAYDEIFHDGVNIIRGSNSSGKSTIADFIFYILGGDFANWKPEARACEWVIAEVVINEVILTLKREVSDQLARPLFIYWGPFIEAEASATEGWKQFPFKRSRNTNSFSQILFNAFSFPEVQSDDENNLTMHQILRLLYIDQLSSVDSLLKEEKFDPPLIRRAIGDMLLGLFDSSIFHDEIELRKKRKRLEVIKEALKNLLEVFIESDQEIDIIVVENKISVIEDQLSSISKSIHHIESTELKKSEAESLLIERIDKELKPQKRKLSLLIEKISENELEIADSELFVISLERRLSMADESLATIHELGQLPIKYCPQCHSSLEIPDSADICILCHQEITHKGSKSQTLRMKQELLQQISDSEQVNTQNHSVLSQLEGELPELREEVKILQNKLNEAISSSKSSRDEKIDALLTDKGSLENQLVTLKKQIKAIGLIEGHKRRSAQLESEITELHSSIEFRLRNKEKRLSEAQDTISDFAIQIVKHDLDYEKEFSNGIRVDIDFNKNTFRLDNRYQFSASSLTYLRNCVRFGVFFASLELAFFRYPRFILCDNLEDKGTEERRSQNLQRLIVELSEQSDTPHQIIMMTSMIDPSLNGPPLCVGDEYEPNNKSLKV